MANLRVLISGASVAGPALAYWLKRTGIKCTVSIVEQAPYLRTAGQGLDVRDTARDVIKQMNIFETMRERSSQEEGVALVDSDNRYYARFPTDLESGKGDSPSSDIEILRGELSKILFDVTKDDVSYTFGDQVESVEETGQDVKVNFANGKPSEPFDLVVAADGIGSKIRKMVFGDASHIRSLDSYVSYFSIPFGDTDSLWSRVHWLPEGRAIWLRPDNTGRTRAFFMVLGSSKDDERLARFRTVAKKDEEAQKALAAELFTEAGWESSRIIKGMNVSDDFYLQHVAQVKMDYWSRGHVTVVGDAGYACSPFAGGGTSNAFLGAYVLAGEISKQPDNIPAALESYERILHPYVTSVQDLPYGVPQIGLPQTKLGVWILTTCLSMAAAVSGSRLGAVLHKIGSLIPWGDPDAFKLPEYEAFKEQRMAASKL